MFKASLSQEVAETRKGTKRPKNNRSEVGENQIMENNQDEKHEEPNEASVSGVNRASHRNYEKEEEGMKDQYPNKDNDQKHVTMENEKENIDSRALDTESSSIPSYVKKQPGLNLIVELHGYSPDIGNSQEVVEEIVDETVEVIRDESPTLFVSMQDKTEENPAQDNKNEVCERNGLSPVTRCRSREEEFEKEQRQNSSFLQKGGQKKCLM